MTTLEAALEAAAMRLGQFRVEGPPVPKARARTFTDKNGKVHTVTPAGTRAYERLIALSWRGPRLFAGAVRVTLRVIEGPGHPADLDNYVKSVLDGLNGVAWHDDKQVIWIDASIIRDDAHPAIDVIVDGWES